MTTALRAAQARLDVSAGNLANASTDGFRKRVSHAALTESGIRSSSAIDEAPGALRHTGRNFDLAVTDGALLLQAGGKVVEARSGSFTLDGSGHLRDEHGRLLLGSHGPLVATSLATIDSRGVVRDGDRELGRLRVRTGTVVESGFLEASNVDA
ncbi:MAG TPA: flagellar basal body protein, partial [Candidatus Baltobacteraceae bacterium]|nr:flagellar basal body protein [Candidatus Baltobacteraceae bacterium]